MKTFLPTPNEKRGKDILIWNLNQNGSFSIASVKNAIAKVDLINVNNVEVFKKL